MTDKQAEAMKLNITKAVTENLNVFPCGGMYEFRLETKHGLLRLSPCSTAIRTRFDDIPEGASPSGTSLNPYSGKWNFEFGTRPEQVEIDQAIQHIKAISL